VSVALPGPGRMEGRTVVVTGASSGIGRAAARELALLGAEVAVVGRNRERTEAVAAETGGRAFLADFDRLASVRDLAAALLDAYPAVHVLANNAGGMAERGLTTDGNGITFQRNHLAPFLLTTLLLDRLRASGDDVRVIQTSSDANVFGRVRLDDLDALRRPWLVGWPAYSAAKLENILFTRELARRTVGTGIGTWTFHPGFVATSFGGDNPLIAVGKRFAISPEEGAQQLVRLAATPTVPAPSGNHFVGLKAPGRTARQADDAALGRALWEASAARVGA
jgi:NAD(P)-dependent dehydrogenase (short-subunit alcohol dehydrogenase family)